MRRRLSLAALDDLPATARPLIDPRDVSAGIVHLGIGAFHRAHQAVFTQAAMAAAGDLSWGITGVSQRSRTVADQLRPQDGLYAVLERSADGTSARVVGSVHEVLTAAEDVEPVLARMAASTTRLITLTVTEKGYRLRPSTGRLDVSDPEVSADLAGRPPQTVAGQLVRGLERRMRAGAGPITVICCDNLPANGRVVARLIADFCDGVAGAGALTDWITANVRFPSTVVDRIVPATVDADRAEVARLLGVEDQGTVVAESFIQWVIEDDFATDRPAWDKAGATLTSDVEPYETMKLRLLNGSHSTLAYLGALAGHAFIADAMSTPELAELVHRLMTDEVLPTLTVPDGFDVDAHIATLLERFANPALHHRTTQVAMDGSQKLPQRLLAPARILLQRGKPPALIALAVAGWMRFVSTGQSEAGEPLPVEDPLADRITGASVQVLMDRTEIFGDDLSTDPIFRSLVVEAFERLSRDGVVAAVRATLAG